MNRRAFALALAALPAMSLPAVAKEARSGTFSGRSGHVTTGGVRVTLNDDGSATVTLAADFSLDGAPDARVGMGRRGRYDASSDAGPLRQLTGQQSYTVPASANPDRYDLVYIWCRRFSVPLGVAQIS